MADLPPLREVIAKHGLSASKALGQNFLFDKQTAKKCDPAQPQMREVCKNLETKRQVLPSIVDDTQIQIS